MMDGYATGASSVIDRGFYEVTEYGTEMFLTHTTFPVGANLNWWNSLPEDVQEAIMEASKVAQEASWEKAMNDDQMYKDKMRENGMELYKPTPEELELWKESAAPLYDEFAKTSDKAKEIVEEMKK